VWTLALAPAHAQDAKAVIAGAMKAMGSAELDAIMLAGTAAEGNFGQSRTITFGLASTSIKNYVLAIDFANAALHATGDGEPGAPGRRDPPAHTRSRPLPPRRGRISSGSGSRRGDFCAAPPRTRPRSVTRR
jgi:hypothetical protein